MSVATFSELNLAPALLTALQEENYHTPTAIQAQTIPLILAGADVMGSAQTGTGKTAAFVLPLLHNLLSAEVLPDAVKVLILTPTRELAQQVFASVERYAAHTEIKAALAYGGASIGPQIKAIKGAQIVVATPGRLLDHVIKGSIKLSSINALVFDEADRMLDMGFIDEIKRILRHVPKERQTLLFSATFDDSIFKLSKQLLNDPKLVEVNKRNSAAVEVEQLVYAVDEDRKRELVSHMIGMKNWQQVLIFTRTKQTADVLAKEMCKDGLKTESIHGDKSQGARDKALQNFKSGATRVLVATDVAARGLDIASLKYVINYELPYVAEDYVHRIGRTGRAGEKGMAMSLVSIDEQWLLDEIDILLDTRLTPQWLPGYEPDLTKEPKQVRKNTNKARRSRDKKRILGQKSRRRS
ncbi:DEAD/DEAH box helicase [Pseudoalteromonas shioyasakiensis]|jgi:superfamily II DNA/RNA helicase|uniref:DEAD/DEAH box helicase n=1 Tax=Pseudoalteromonas shioyasakiensis TaxID=1190813 RepID=A0ABT6TZR9_9GAMM|nr:MULTISPECIES: DEAD/DEAH box helicase [Pseudoalteromonas]MCO6354650.1 DEAD/DEAH box helicase [Pseudoalteromonas shioyasakiensis]MDI4669280.1 DEAD/DEAH box helicase [Pseudoalteromonas shioyasakiensis]MDI4686024.1 DEAD/DEAH box helicase [Pseudoalteromonas shioyasakiensis]MDI4704314.1 DEAD/DEAH box helicase [Pseudoalteromonas shioyasakiensis]NUJ22626.1 DEAD/DEAH box helicase [Pseudoalteromonas sp. 0802]